jgi:hypothetical protein
MMFTPITFYHGSGGALKKVCFFALTLLLLSGCSSTTIIGPSNSDGSLSYPLFNLKIRWSQVKVELFNNRSFIAREIHVQDDSTSFLDVRANVWRVVPTHEISSIERNDRDAGHFRGILAGAATGIAAGAIAYSSTNPSGGFEPVVSAGLIVSGAMLGGVVGNVVGAAIGVSEHYIVARDTLQTK